MGAARRKKEMNDEDGNYKVIHKAQEYCACLDFEACIFSNTEFRRGNLKK